MVRPPSEPANRWPWFLMALGLLILVVAAAAFLLAGPRQTNVDVASSGTPSGQRPQGAPPTLAPPSRGTAASSPTPTAAVLVTPTTPTPSPSPTATLMLSPPPVASPQVTPTAPAPPTPAGQPPTPPASQPTPGSVPASGQISPPGGLGNTQEDIQATYGPPTGETQRGLVVYRKGTTEHRVGYTVAPRRAVMVAEVLPPNGPLALDAAQAESRKLIPWDTQPRAPRPEGNADFVVERFTSPALAQVIPPGLVGEVGVNPGDFVVVYAKNGQGQIARIVVGAGDDPKALLDRSQ